jgi:hypothetical protein
MKMRYVCDIKFFAMGHNKQVDRFFGFGCAKLSRKYEVAENRLPTLFISEICNNHGTLKPKVFRLVPQGGRVVWLSQCIATSPSHKNRIHL